MALLTRTSSNLPDQLRSVFKRLNYNTYKYATAIVETHIKFGEYILKTCNPECTPVTGGKPMWHL
jgi:hypothetical protein